MFQNFFTKDGIFYFKVLFAGTFLLIVETVISNIAQIKKGNESIKIHCLKFIKIMYISLYGMDITLYNRIYFSNNYF